MTGVDVVLVFGHVGLACLIWLARLEMRKVSRWARENDLLLFSARYSLFDRPHDLGRTYGAVYKVAVMTPAGERKQGWVYCSATLDEVIAVRWKIGEEISPPQAAPMPARNRVP